MWAMSLTINVMLESQRQISTAKRAKISVVMWFSELMRQKGISILFSAMWKPIPISEIGNTQGKSENLRISKQNLDEVIF